MRLVDGGETGLIDEYKLGKNKQFNTDMKEFHALCNICEKEINEIRWICLNCKPGSYKLPGFVDICSDCMNILQIQENNEKKTEYLTLLAKDNHEDKTHVYLRVCFGDSYKDY